MEDLHTVDLTDQERYVLVRGVAEWGGPAHSIDTLTVAMGFSSTADLHSEGRRLGEALRHRQPLTTDDWRRTLVAAEIAFASDVYGSGCDWSITTGLSDEETIQLLRSAQREIARSARIHQQ